MKYTTLLKILSIAEQSRDKNFTFTRSNSSARFNLQDIYNMCIHFLNVATATQVAIALHCNTIVNLNIPNLELNIEAVEAITSYLDECIDANDILHYNLKPTSVTVYTTFAPNTEILHW